MEPPLQDLITRLDRLSDDFSELREGVRKAVLVADLDPEMALTRARKVLEYVVRDVFERRINEPPGTRPLENLLQRLLKDGFFPERLDAYANFVRKLGNVGTHHFGEGISANDVYQSLKQLMPILEWYFEVERPDPAARRSGAPAPEPPPPIASPARIVVVPKGLRSFDAADSDFFLALLPGPRDQDGLPESLRFWKYRIEESREPTFAVGVIYGPSGCGKSSLVKAGLLPRLAPEVLVVYVEATPDETEARLLAGLQKRLPALPSELGLAQALTALRQGQGLDIGPAPCHGPRPRVVLIVDQFEQWLHAHAGESDSELARALRQCDGENLRAILMVRDDFWMGLTRFLDDIGVELLQGQNAAAVDLFDLIHARRVLAAFGQAFGRLPGPGSELTPEHGAFLDQATRWLAQDGRVISIRLALFAEMVKGKEWTPATLAEAGTMERIGVAFLDETFRAPALRHHENAAQALLKALLPERGTDIKGHMRSRQELRAAAGESVPLEVFDVLLRALDRDVRLITPTDPEGQAGTAANAVRGSDAAYYQLTHDYLVPSLREWLTRKQGETRRGRAELLLAERAGLWRERPENRFLPSASEWCRIRQLTRRQDWTEPQRRMMRTAARVHGARLLGVLLLVGLLVGTGLEMKRRSFEETQKAHALDLVNDLFKVDTADVDDVIKEMKDYRRWVDPELRRRLPGLADSSRAKLHVSLALLPDPGQVEFLFGRLLSAGPAEQAVLGEALKPHQVELVPRLWPVVDSAPPDDSRLLPAAAALALYDPAGRRWTAVAPKVAGALVSINPIYLGPWMSVLEPVRGMLTDPLAAIFSDQARSQAERIQATNILADYAARDPRLLAELMLSAEPGEFAILFPVARRQAGQVASILRAELGKTPLPPWSDPPLLPSWLEPNPALGRRIDSAQGVLTGRFAFCQTMALDEFLSLAEGLRPAGYRPTRLRPYADGQAVRVAAVWIRDGRSWRIATGLTAAEITKTDAELRSGNLIPIDVAAYETAAQDGARIIRHAAVWAERASDKDDARMYVAASAEDHKKAWDPLKTEGYIPCALHALRAEDGTLLYSAVWGKPSKPGGPWWMNTDQSETLHESNVLERTDKLLWDVHLSRAAEPVDPQVRAAHDLQEAEAAVQARPADLAARSQRAEANFRLRNDRSAIDELTDIIAKAPEMAPEMAKAYRYRALAHARRQERREAMDDLTSYQKRAPSDSARLCVEVGVSAALDDESAPLKRLEALVESYADRPVDVYNAACAYSLAAGAVADRDVARSKLYAARALELLGAATQRGYWDYHHLQTDTDLEPLWAYPGFRALLTTGKLAWRYEGIWQAAPTFTAVESHGLGPAEHLERCRDWIAQGYRPVALAVAAVVPDQPLTTASAWRRPVVPDAARERLHQRQARAAVAMLRLGQAEDVWRLLRHTPDPSVRSFVVHALKPLGVDPKVLIAKLESLEHPYPPTAPSPAERATGMDSILFDPVTSLRRALILALGEYPSSLPAGTRDELDTALLEAYRNDPDAGIHGAAEWTLRQWNQVEALKKAEAGLPRFEDRGNRRWFVNSQGQTLVLIEGPLQFTMGSPATEQGRADVETPHHQRINRRFAIAAQEVTRDQYGRFLEANPKYSRVRIEQYSADPEGPQVALDWYDAAAYCNWLSEREEIPRNQWCYEPNDKGAYAEGMTIAADFRHRSGYRLPTETEWEYACRGGALTSHYYGESLDLLGHYAWHLHNTPESRAGPCGRKKPNELGLFDTLGNAGEWCQDQGRAYGPGEGLAGDDNINIITLVTDKMTRCNRGASFTFQPVVVRAAYRTRESPARRAISFGFRIARTYP
jgi:formylglycine-generating enzyme required for sulfatase activity